MFTGVGKAVCPACIDSTVTQTGQWENVEPVLADLRRAVCQAVCRPNPHKEQGVPRVCPLFSEGRVGHSEPAFLPPKCSPFFRLKPFEAKEVPTTHPALRVSVAIDAALDKVVKA